MNLRRIFGLDLAGRLGTWKRRYKGDTRLFDHTAVWCHVTRWGDKRATLTASAYCADPTAIGLGAHPSVRFYSSPELPSSTDAELHLRNEVSRAAAKFTETTFYRKIDSRDHAFVMGKWVSTEDAPTFWRCRGCGFKSEETFCPQSGELIG